MRLLVALLAATLPLTGNGEAQLLPAGSFAARDGRPGPGKQWTLSDAQGLNVAAALNAIAARTPVVIDYDHQTLHAEKNGQKAPAAGWIKGGVEWRPGQGMFCAVEWTAAAKAHIDAKEYLYISPVITFDAAGNVTGVLLAALVNYPAITGMSPAVAALSALSSLSNPEPDMTVLAALIAALGIAADTKESDAIAAVSALKATIDARNSAPLVPTALSAALGLQAGATEQAALAAVTTLKQGEPSTLQLVAALQAEVNQLKATGADRGLAELLDKAVADQKIAPAAREQYAAIGRKDLAALSALVTALPAIPGLGGQSGGKKLDDLSNTGPLTTTQAALAAQLGIDPTKYAELLKAQA